MHTQLRVACVSEQCHGAHQRFWLERDVVVHEQHVRCPTLFAQFDEPASKATGTTKVAVWHHLQRSICRRVKRNVLRIVYNEHAHTAAQCIDTALQLQYIAYGFTNVFLTIERGDG